MFVFGSNENLFFKIWALLTFSAGCFMTVHCSVAMNIFYELYTIAMFPETPKCAVSPRQYDTNTISVLMFFAKKCIQHPIYTPGPVNQKDTQYIQTREKNWLVTYFFLTSIVETL